MLQLLAAVQPASLSQVSERVVLAQKAYMLFYIRRSPLPAEGAAQQSKQSQAVAAQHAAQQAERSAAGGAAQQGSLGAQPQPRLPNGIMQSKDASSQSSKSTLTALPTARQPGLANGLLATAGCSHAAASAAASGSATSGAQRGGAAGTAGASAAAEREEAEALAERVQSGLAAGPSLAPDLHQPEAGTARNGQMASVAAKASHRLQPQDGRATQQAGPDAAEHSRSERKRKHAGDSASAVRSAGVASTPEPSEAAQRMAGQASTSAPAESLPQTHYALKRLR